MHSKNRKRMANKSLEIMDLKQLLRLKVAGKSNRQIGEIIGRSRNTVNDYVSLFSKSDLSLEALSKLEPSDLHNQLLSLKAAHIPKVDKDRLAELEANKEIYLKDLKRPGATYQTIWYQYKEAFPQGYSYTRFKHYLQSFDKRVDYSMPMQHKYGDKLFIDYTGKKLPIVDRKTGEVTQAEVYIGILGASNYTYVEASNSQKLEDFINCTVNCLEYFGGVPQALVPDNLKSAVTKASTYEATINRHYKSMAMHYDTIVYPTRAAKPRDKSLVEGAVKLVYQRIFFHLSKQVFFSLAELNEQIHLLLEKYNNQPFYKQTQSRKERFLAEEKGLLSPLPPYRFEPKQTKNVKVQNNCHVWLEQHYYSVPYTYVGKHVRLEYNNKSVEIYLSFERIAIHKRSQQRWVYTTIKEHMPSEHQYVMNWSAERFIRWGKKIGVATGTYIEKVLNRSTYPEQAYKSSMGILSFAKRYTPERLEKACLRGLLYEKYSYRTIDRILNLKLDQLEEETEEQTSLPDHDNIRGASYYE